ncbi:hypothetical protein ACHAW5_005770 [Stephanodiscus triporus]|uniref:Uncharacterized protein n=1 Tax=Stephanodiscus triporus TaxID=2934178 RepID=A0ABD3MC77_9STRA
MRKHVMNWSGKRLCCSNYTVERYQPFISTCPNEQVPFIQVSITYIRHINGRIGHSRDFERFLNTVICRRHSVPHLSYPDELIGLDSFSTKAARTASFAAFYHVNTREIFQNIADIVCSGMDVYRRTQTSIVCNIEVATQLPKWRFTNI